MRSILSVSAALSLILALQAQGHAIITPALGGGTTRADVKRPTDAAPCGNNVDIASLMATSEAIPVQNGQIAATITNFNLGLDGSRAVTAQIDPTGTGNNFQPATVATNGDKFSLDKSSQPIAIQVPAEMQSTSGMMLVSLKNAFGFGNCIMATNGAAASNSTSTATGTGTGNTTTTDTGAATGTGSTTTTATGTGTGAAQGAAAQAPTAGGPLAGALAGLKSKLGLKTRFLEIAARREAANY